MSERDARVYEDGSSSLSPRYPRVMSSSSLSSTISEGGDRSAMVAKRNDGSSNSLLDEGSRFMAARNQRTSSSREVVVRKARARNSSMGMSLGGKMGKREEGL